MAQSEVDYQIIGEGMQMLVIEPIPARPSLQKPVR